MTTPVLVLGAASWNRMVHVDALPQGHAVTIPHARQTEGVGSTGVGKSMVLATLGYDVTLHCTLGRDDLADKVQQACADRGIKMIVDLHDDPTAQHLNIMDQAGGRYSIFLSNGADKPELDTVRLERQIAQVETIFLSLAPSSKCTLPLLQGSSAEVLLDLHDYDEKNRWYDDFIACADIVQLSNVALPAPDPVVRKLLAGRATQVALTKGDKGAEINTTDTYVSVLACPAVLRDSNGAGDAFSVALWHAQRGGMTIERAGRFAAAAAAFAVEYDGLFPPNISEQDIVDRSQLHDPT